MDGNSQQTSGGTLDAAVRRLASSLKEAQYSVAGAFNQLRPLSDPQHQTAASLLSFNITARTLYGVVTDATAIENVYRVQLEKSKTPMVALYGSRTSQSLFGAKELTTLLPGTRVTCIVHEQLPYAQIITVMPPISAPGSMGRASVLHGATRQRVDEAHTQPFRLADGYRIPAALGGRPIDAIGAGESGWITETGLRILIQSFMVLMGVDEGCQLSFHYHDMLCRLAAYQYQFWSAGREHESLNDQDEVQDWTGYALYPWENLGLAARSDPTRILDAATWQIEQPWYGKMEPLDDRLMPFHREREFHGYLGQGGKRCLVAPPQEFSDDGDRGSSSSLGIDQGERSQFLTYAGGGGISDAYCPGLYDHFVTTDGRACFQSAKGILLSKRAIISNPTRRRRPEEPAGDNPQNYKFSDVLGSGPDHKITGDIETQGEHSGFSRALGELDMHAYFFNYAGLHPFFYHAQDYKLYEESDAEWVGGQSEAVPDFSRLASEAYLDPEDYRKTWRIDHRYGEQQFYTLASAISLTDDGGVVISDGYGSCIRMVGGSIEISAPGDIWLRSGRNVNLWSGHDAVIRAKNSWDVTATNGDGRLKAGQNLMAMADEGGVLLESRGQNSEFNFEELGESARFSGIVLRAPRSQLVTWSQGAYIRTGGPEGASGPAVGSGPIVLDANRGQQSVVVHAAQMQQYVNGVYWHFGTSPEREVSGPTASVTQQSAVFPGSASFGGHLVADGFGVFGGSLSVLGQIGAINPVVGELQGESLSQSRDVIETYQEITDTTLPQQVGQALQSQLQAFLYDAGRPGNDESIRSTEFGLRTREDYRTESFRVYEDRWQQLSRLSRQSPQTWREQPVTSGGRVTYPYPGREAYEATGDAAVYIQQGLTMFDPQNGRSKDRGDQPQLADVYATPRFGEQTPVSLQEYPCIY